MKIIYCLIDIYHEINYWFQRRIRGFDDSDLWNVNCAILEYIHKILIAFKKYPRNGYPGQLTEEQWEEYLDLMIDAFNDKEDDGELKLDHPGFKLFIEYFGYLWD